MERDESGLIFWVLSVKLGGPLWEVEEGERWGGRVALGFGLVLSFSFPSSFLSISWHAQTNRCIKEKKVDKTINRKRRS